MVLKMNISNLKHKEKEQESEDNHINNTLLADSQKGYQKSPDDSLASKEDTHSKQSLGSAVTIDKNNVILSEHNSHTTTSNVTKNNESCFGIIDTAIPIPNKCCDTSKDGFAYPDDTTSKKQPSSITNVSEEYNCIPPSEDKDQTITSVVSENKATINLSIPSTSKPKEPLPTSIDDSSHFISKNYKSDISIPSTSKPKEPLPTSIDDSSHFISKNYKSDISMPSTSKYKEPLPSSSHFISKKYKREMPSTSKYKEPLPSSSHFISKKYRPGMPSTSKYKEPFPSTSHCIPKKFRPEMPSTSKYKEPLPSSSHYIPKKFRPEMPSTSKYKEPLPSSSHYIHKKYRPEMPSTSKYKGPRPNIISHSSNFTTSKFKEPFPTCSYNSKNYISETFQSYIPVASTSQFDSPCPISTLPPKNMDFIPFDYQIEISAQNSRKLKRPHSTSSMTPESINIDPIDCQTMRSIPTSSLTGSLPIFPFGFTDFFSKDYQPETSIPNTSKLKRLRPTCTVTSENANLFANEYQPFVNKMTENINLSIPNTSGFKSTLPSSSTVTSESLNLIPNEYHPEISPYITKRKETTNFSAASTNKLNGSLPTSTVIPENLGLIPNDNHFLPKTVESIPSTSKSQSLLQKHTLTPESVNLTPNENQSLPTTSQSIASTSKEILPESLNLVPNDNQSLPSTSQSIASTSTSKRSLLIPNEYVPERLPNVPEMEARTDISMPSTSTYKKPLPTSTVTPKSDDYIPLDNQPGIFVPSSNKSKRLLPTSFTGTSSSGNFIPVKYGPKMSPSIPSNKYKTKLSMPSTSKFKRYHPMYYDTFDGKKRKKKNRFFGSLLTNEDMASKNFNRLYGIKNKPELEKLGLIPRPDITQPVHLKVGKINNTALFCMRKTNDPETAGFNSVRGDFDVEFDNNAEQLMSYADWLYDLVCSEERECDYKLMNELQVALGDIYNSCLQDRSNRKEILQRFGLMNQRGAKTWYSKYEMILGKVRMKKLVRALHLMSAEGAEQLFSFLSILNEKRAEVNKLCFYRSQRGISTNLGKNIYEVAKCDRDADSERVEVRNLMVPQTVKRKKTSMEIFHLPRYRDLKPNEVELCSSVALTPEFYLDTKDQLIEDCKKNDGMVLKRARKLVKIDVNKTRKIYDFLLEQGFIWNPAQEEEPVKKRKNKKKKSHAAKTKKTDEPKDIC